VKNPRRFTLGTWSTFGQTALLIVAVLVVAQFFAFFLLRNLIDEWQSSYVVQPTLARFADVAHEIASAPAARRAQVLFTSRQMGERLWLAPDMQFHPFGQQTGLESGLAEALKKRAVPFSAVLAARGGGPGGWGADIFRSRPGSPPENGLRGRADPGPGPDGRFVPVFRYPGRPPGQMNDEIRLAVRLADGNWLVGRFMVAKPVPVFLNPIFISQIVVFALLLTTALFWASRISRPLRILSRAAERLRPQKRFAPIPVEGPRDVRAAVASFNTMAERVHDLVREKDHMLSAIGHDLRTPLASLRIRAESVEPESERERFVETIDEMTKMVDEILSLARLGHSNEPRELVDLAALADSVVEEFHGLGKDVTFVEARRTPVVMQVGPVRRLLRNLIDNAVKYGERATVSVGEREGLVELSVEDEGPGIPAERLGEVLQPFTRLESSRSRRTGGSGLGLSIADAIARSQGAELVLQNRPSGGLSASVRWIRPA
jgi:signal transduction histidine kinase